MTDPQQSDEFGVEVLRAIPLSEVRAFPAFDPSTGEPALGLAFTPIDGRVWPLNGTVVVGVLRSDLAGFLREVRTAAEKVHEAVQDGSEPRSAPGDQSPPARGAA